MSTLRYPRMKPQELPFPSLGELGLFRLLDLHLPGIVSSRVRHVIKRYLKRSGFRDLKVEHVSGDTPFTVRLIVLGRPLKPLSKEELRRIEHLRTSLARVLSEGVNHPSRVDAERLRLLLARVEPSLKRAYYTKNTENNLNRTLSV